jgi:hypothetical protein
MATDKTDSMCKLQCPSTERRDTCEVLSSRGSDATYYPSMAAGLVLDMHGHGGADCRAQSCLGLVTWCVSTCRASMCGVCDIISFDWKILLVDKVRGRLDGKIFGETLL